MKESFMSEKCCVCGESVKSQYSYFESAKPGKQHIYSGHKHCLMSVPRLLREGKKMPHSEMEFGGIPKKEEA